MGLHVAGYAEADRRNRTVVLLAVDGLKDRSLAESEARATKVLSTRSSGCTLLRRRQAVSSSLLFWPCDRRLLQVGQLADE